MLQLTFNSDLGSSYSKLQWKVTQLIQVLWVRHCIELLLLPKFKISEPKKYFSPIENR